MQDELRPMSCRGHDSQGGLSVQPSSMLWTACWYGSKNSFLIDVLDVCPPQKAFAAAVDMGKRGMLMLHAHGTGCK